MAERLDHGCKLITGQRDAVHVPIVAGEYNGDPWERDIVPGEWVRFVDDKFEKFEPCLKAEAHGIVNPFLEKVPAYETVLILLKPGITTPVRHEFHIVPHQPEFEKRMLEIELEDAKKGDPGCAECYYVENGEVRRG